MKSIPLLKKFEATELRLCIRINKACAYRFIREFFSVISWLGDGRIWYALAALLPLAFGIEGLRALLDMALVGILAHLVYRLIKQKTRRPRPYVQSLSILQGAAALDQYSFPSGHTLHAVAFTLVIIAHFPTFAMVLVPLTLLIAASRIVLGLHFPTDVALGAIIGAVLAKAVPLVLPLI
ncbi:MAG: phosphatase PAP2 family protein [Lysobacterales bacterium]|jgi:undecaprenyl-diphosphatase